MSTSDATLFSMSRQSAMIKSLVQPPPEFQRVSDECSLKHLRTLIFRTDSILHNFQFRMDNQMEFQILFFTRLLSVCQFVLYVLQTTKTLHGTSPPLVLTDPTEPEVHMYLFSLNELRFRQFRWFLTGLGLLCCDSNTSLHKHG